ncbi:MAG: DeoR/GlpR transcriptional regulator [Clostridia bacterium]|nr:DeoR/GlpR transcriptional regulator [Clostridia bacterium]
MRENNEREILRILDQKKSVKVNELVELLSVSPSTVRRELKDLEEKGLISRTHGGAMVNDEKNYFPAFSFRSHQNSLGKKKIALSAIKLIKNGDVVFLDGSTSAFFIAEYLKEFENVKVFTNGIDTLSLLSKHNVTAYSTGGKVSKENSSVLVGHYAENTIKSIHADVAFFSAQSILSNGEIYDCFEEENVLRKVMLDNSKVKVFLCDGTKFGRTAPFRLCNVNDVDYVISDAIPKNYFTEPIDAVLEEI